MSSPAAARPRADVLFAARRPRPRRPRRRRAPRRGKIVAPAAATGVSDLLAGARARAARAARGGAVPERVDATAPGAPPPPAEAPGPRARAAGARDAGAVQGRHARFNSEVPPRRLPAVLRRRPRGGRVVQCERGSLEVIDRRAAVEAKLRRRAPKEIRPALGAEPSPPRARALDALPSTVVEAALEPRGRSAGDRRGAQRREPRRGAPGPRAPRPNGRDFAGRTAADAAPSTRVARAVRFGAGDDAHRRWTGRSEAPSGPSTGTPASRRADADGAGLRPGRARTHL